MTVSRGERRKGRIHAMHAAIPFSTYIHLQFLPTSGSQAPRHTYLCRIYHKGKLTLITGWNKGWLSCTGFVFLPEALEESIFCQADTKTVTESAIYIEFILFIDVLLLLSFPWKLGMASGAFASSSRAFKYAFRLLAPVFSFALPDSCSVLFWWLSKRKNPTSQQLLIISLKVLIKEEQDLPELSVQLLFCAK